MDEKMCGKLFEKFKKLTRKQLTDEEIEKKQDNCSHKFNDNGVCMVCDYECTHDDDTCQHNEHDHGICLDCGKDILDRLVGEAECKFEGDR